tara:strand:+ start:4166 stop:4867 length:702 start_codon:yes stop_codon:yes gene_type:complete
MYDFGKLMYLDLNKTGSKFVLSFLNGCLKFKLLEGREHEPVRDAYKPDAFHIITVRHPYSLYSSLFRYGLEEKGLVFQRLRQAGYLSLYKQENFNEWVAFVLDSRNSKILGEGYENLPDNFNIGFLSYRFLRLALIYPHKLIDLYKGFSDPVAVLLKNSIVDHVLQNENLETELQDLAINLKPDFFDQKKVIEFFANSKAVNASTIKAKSLEEINVLNKKIIQEKEYLLMNLY